MRIGDFIRNHKRLSVAVLVAAVVLVLSGMVFSRHGDQPRYMTAKVQRGNITAFVQATGTINPLTTVPVGSYVSGNVKYIFADFNTHVRAGQVLAQIDPTPFEAQVITASGQLAAARANLQNLEASLQAMQAALATEEANLKKAEADLAYAQANARRTDDLYKQGIISQDQNDLAQSTLGQKVAAVEAARAQVNQTRAQIEQVKAQIAQARGQVQAASGTLRQAEANLRYTTIVSPIDGVVVARNITVGQAVASSLSAQTLFTVAQDLKRMQVYAQVDESDTGNIKIGAEATFQVDAFPTEVFHGRVSAIRLNATTVQNVVTYSCVIDFENPDEKLLPGETAYVTIPTGFARNTLMVPNSALIFTPSLPPQQLMELYRKNNIPRAAYTNHLGGWQVVWKLDANNNPVPVAVKVGITDLNHTQILEGNLNEGDTIIIGQASLGAAGRGNARPGMGPGPGGPVMIRR